jgi:hypothetical protein
MFAQKTFVDLNRDFIFFHAVEITRDGSHGTHLSHLGPNLKPIGCRDANAPE